MVSGAHGKWAHEKTQQCLAYLLIVDETEWWLALNREGKTDHGLDNR